MTYNVTRGMRKSEDAANDLLRDMEVDQAMEAVMVEYLEEKCGDTPRPVKIASGGTTWTCIKNSPERAHPKKK